MPRLKVAKERKRRILSEKMREFHEKRRLQKRLREIGLKNDIKKDPQLSEMEYDGHGQASDSSFIDKSSLYDLCIPTSWMQPSDVMVGANEIGDDDHTGSPEYYSSGFRQSLGCESSAGLEMMNESTPLEVNEHHSSIMNALLEDSTFADVTLVAQGQKIQAHKAVLSAMSPYLRDVLQGNPCQHPVIIMPFDVQYQDLQGIINFIYKGEITLPSENVSSFLRTAQGLQVSGLPQTDIFGKMADDIPSSKTVKIEAKVACTRSAANESLVQGSDSSACWKRDTDEIFSELEHITPTRTVSKSPRFINDDENFILISNIMDAEDIKLEEYEEDSNDHRPEDTNQERRKSVLQSDTRNCQNVSDLSANICIRDELPS